MICKCGCTQYRVIKQGSGEITVRCMECPCEYELKGVYPLSIDFPDGELLPLDQSHITVRYQHDPDGHKPAGNK